MGIFAVRTHGLADQPLDGVASLGKRPTVDDSGRVLLEVHCLEWPAALGAEGGYGKLVRVELLHKLRDEARYDGLEALTPRSARTSTMPARCCARTRRRTWRPAARPRATEFDLWRSSPRWRDPIPLAHAAPCAWIPAVAGMTLPSPP